MAETARRPSRFQFTLPRGERPVLMATLEMVTRVSIHAPAGGATPSPASLLRTTLFQFTLPRGERPWSGSAWVFERKFQFTLPRGERPPAAVATATARKFQFTLPRGERLRTE